MSDTIPAGPVPVTDWATDFDHTDPAYNEHVHEIWDDLRATCPVAHTDRFGGTWLPTRHEDVVAIAYDTDHFTSQGVIVSPIRPEEPRPMGGAPPSRRTRPSTRRRADCSSPPSRPSRSRRTSRRPARSAAT